MKREELMQQISSGEQDIDLADFQRRMNLPDDWQWDDLANVPVDEIVLAIHQGLS